MYFEKVGRENTSKTVELAMNKAKELSIKYIVIATTTGETLDYLKNIDDLNIVCVTHAYGFKEPGTNELTDIKREELLKRGFKVCTAAHILSGAERGISNKFGGTYPIEIMANTLRMFGQGVKVCVEVATMAADAGLIPVNEPIVVIAGTVRGADTAVVMRGANANHILDTKIDQIICKPIV
jgi:hypothetical protein